MGEGKGEGGGERWGGKSMPFFLAMSVRNFCFLILGIGLVIWLVLGFVGRKRF
jgi:hypothetical protein